ncbi:MAG: DUF4132 domain-containing protein [Tannerellaceae bacterium]|jgi:hypothetical protein|nr:DUF4132 domain-containing protein [Tannerellaceae bacterium]
MQLFTSSTQSDVWKNTDPLPETDSLPLPAVEADADFMVKKAFPLLHTPLFNKLIGNAQPAAFLLFDKLNALIRLHARHEYTASTGLTCLLGDTCTEMKGAEYRPRKLDRFPLPDLWREFYRIEIGDFPTLLQMLFVLATNWGEGQSYKVYEFMNKEFLPEIRKFYGFDLHGLKKSLAKLPHFNTLNTVLQLLGEEYWDAAFAQTMADNILAAFSPLLDKPTARKEYVHETYTKKELRTVFIHQHSCISYWMSDAFGRKDSQKAFTDYFTIRYRYYRKSNYLTTTPPAALTRSPLSIFDFAQACAWGLAGEGELRRELLSGVNAEESIALASAFLFNMLKPWQRNRLKAYAAGAGFAPLKELTEKVSAHILDVELQRGDERTAVSHLAMKLERIEGAKLLIDILKAFGQEAFGRIDFYYTVNYTRKEVLSRLLRICYPAETDTAETLASLVKQTGVPNERLVEAAVYAPQWLEIVEACTGWKGLRSAACFFHAHINERCDSRTDALIARFTPVRREDLCFGAFDLAWFRRAYREAGARRFAKVMEAARNIASGSEHARLAAFFDAVNGKTDAADVRRQVEEKRNRDLLMMYGLIPLSKRSNNDLTERYRYFLQFLKESKQFGSQRQECEKKAAELGMLNLAFNAGFPNTERLRWSVETRTFKQIEPLFALHPIDGVKVCLRADSTGKPGVYFFRAGKELIHIPGKMRKNPYVMHLRETAKQLKVLYTHSQAMLEQMMEERIPFLISDLQAFRQNPLLRPWIKHLVFITQDGCTGFYTDQGLRTAGGDLLPLPAPTAEVRIAHPVDLHREQQEEAFRTYIQSKGIVQPFEQIFRQRYEKTDEERALTCSLCCAGERILPGDMAEHLKARHWVPVDDETWQKIYYRQDLVALLETQAGGLSPADLETSTLQRILFLEREYSRPLPVDAVPDSIFSEVVRDIRSLIHIAHNSNH